MSAETDLRERPLPKDDAEQEINLGQYARAVLDRWWLLLVGLIAGVLVGLLISLGQGRALRAQAIVYLGQPFAPDAITPIVTVATSFKLVGQLVESERTLRGIGAKSGINPKKLEKSVDLRAFTVDAPARAGQAGRVIEITVHDVPIKKALVAVELFSQAILERVSGYPNVKLAALKARLAFDEKELKRVLARLDYAFKREQELLTDRSLSSTDRLLAISHYDSIIGFNNARQADLTRARLELKQSLSIAQNYEVARVLEPAFTSREPAPSRHVSAVVGGIIGLLLGILTALVWTPLTTRLRARSGR